MGRNDYRQPGVFHRPSVAHRCVIALQWRPRVRSATFPALSRPATSPFSALRWHVVLAAETTSPGPWTLLKIVLVGLFFNQVLPSGVGGDAVRAWRCHRLGIGVAAAIRSLVLDRVSGYLVQVVLF